VRIHRVMTTDVATVMPQTPLRDVASLFTVHGISGAPVVDAAGRVLGVVSEADVMRVAGGDVRPRSRLTRRPRHARGTAGAEMTSPPVTITPDRTVADAAALMLERRINRLPVVIDGRLVGIVTRADLVRAFLQSDERIEREIRGEVLLRGIYVRPTDVEVSVEQGHVVLEGEVESSGKAERLVELVRQVPGVVSILSHVRWRVDEKAPKGIRAGRSR
jgi:CBS domain-containing protein